MIENQNRTEAAGSRYRQDIDGLRAVAVVPVVLFHFRLAPFSGGYVGVDVFFVISGFLITSLIYAEMREGRFSIVNFYERRVRRILPALFFVLAVATVLALLLLFPVDLNLYARSLIATTVFASNFEFWRQTGYFAGASGTKPLLHTWSLAVEEQFYLIYPAILFAFRKLSRFRLLAIVSAILAASLAFAFWLVGRSPEAAFYLLPSRMWELMLGAVVALGGAGAPRSDLLRNLLAAAGLAMIGCAVFLFSKDTLFPGAAALVPCLGAALIIHAGQSGQTYVGRLLGSPPLVFVGLLSYSLYLWHWPLFVFASYFSPQPLGAAADCALAALSFGMAWISWRFVESPFRGKHAVLTRPRLFALTAVTIVSMVVVGAVCTLTRGLPQRYGSAERAIFAASRVHEKGTVRCFAATVRRIAQGDLCRIGDPKAPVTFALWGDSHAAVLEPAIAAAALQGHRAGLVITRAGCPPLLDVGFSGQPGGACRNFNQAAANFLSGARISEIVLAGRWARYAEGTPFGAEEGRTNFLITDGVAAASPSESRAAFARAVAGTVSRFTASGKKVVIIGPVPEIGAPVSRLVAAQALLHARLAFGVSRSRFLARQQFVLPVLERLASQPGVRLVRPDLFLCPEDRCQTELDGKPLYSDDNHVSLFGAGHLVPMARQALQ